VRYIGVLGDLRAFYFFRLRRRFFSYGGFCFFFVVWGVVVCVAMLSDGLGVTNGAVRGGERGFISESLWGVSRVVAGGGSGVLVSSVLVLFFFCFLFFFFFFFWGGGAMCSLEPGLWLVFGLGRGRPDRWLPCLEGSRRTAFMPLAVCPWEMRTQLCFDVS